MKKSTIITMGITGFIVLMTISAIVTYTMSKPKSKVIWDNGIERTENNLSLVEISVTPTPTLVAIPTVTNTPTPTPTKSITPTPVIKGSNMSNTTPKATITSASSNYNETYNVNVIMGYVICYDPFIVQGTGFGSDAFLSSFETTRYIVKDPENGKLAYGTYYGSHQKIATQIIYENGVPITYYTMGPVPAEWKNRPSITPTVTPKPTGVHITMQKSPNKTMEQLIPEHNNPCTIIEKGNNKIYNNGKFTSFSDGSSPILYNGMIYVPISIASTVGGEFGVNGGIPYIKYKGDLYEFKENNCFINGDGYFSLVNKSYTQNGVTYICYSHIKIIFNALIFHDSENAMVFESR